MPPWRPFVDPGRRGCYSRRRPFCGHLRPFFRCVGAVMDPNLTHSGPRADAFTREIIRNKLLAIASEMGVVLARTSMSPIVYEVLDFACGICDSHGRVIAQDNGLCLFTGTFRPQVESILARHPVATCGPATSIMTNSPYGGGTHTADIALDQPDLRWRRVDRLRHLGDALDRGRRQGPGLPRARFDRDLSGRAAVSATPALQREGELNEANGRHHPGERAAAHHVASAT